jgi:glyoxylase-like metal-dependent hydrolase (beta-lactamase superfamily II)
MNDEIYPFRVGAFECYAISDGTFVYEDPSSAFFTNAPRTELAKALQEQGIAITQWKEYLSPFICLVVKTAQGYLLVDTGIGAGVSSGTGRIIDRLAEVGITPAEVRTVLITHGHGDHIGGNTGRDGQSSFPNARFFMAKTEWEHWTSEKVLVEDAWGATMVRKNLMAIKDQFTLVEQDTEVSPGIRMIHASGHLPGHMIVSVRSGADQLLFTSDTFIHPFHIKHPEWVTEFEHESKQAVATRMQILEKAAQENALVLSFHFPFPGLGYIRTNHSGWEWQPLDEDEK